MIEEQTFSNIYDNQEKKKTSKIISSEQTFDSEFSVICDDSPHGFYKKICVSPVKYILRAGQKLCTWWIIYI